MIFMPASQWPATGQANLQGCRWAGRTKHQDGAALPEFARKVISAEALRTDVWAACSGGQLPLLPAACSLQLLVAHDGSSHFKPTQWPWLRTSWAHQYTPGWSKVTVAEPSWVGGMICWSGGTSSNTAARGRKEEGKKVMHASKDGSMA